MNRPEFQVSEPKPRNRYDRGRKWTPFTLVEIYRLLKENITIREVCKSLNINSDTYYTWLKTKPELRQVVELVEKELAETETFPKWVYQRLSPELQAVWNEIEAFEKEENGIVKIEMLLSDNGKRVRQQIFLHALCVGNFSPSEALSKVNITRRELNKWTTEDPDFAELVQEIGWHKGNYFESRLVDMVTAGESAAVIFANRTYNKERGYALKTESSVDVKVSGQVLHGVMDLTELMPFLSDSAKNEMLEAIRKSEEKKSLSITNQPLDITDKVAREISRAAD